jgi:hypothetical protein
MSESKDVLSVAAVLVLGGADGLVVLLLALLLAVDDVFDGAAPVVPLAWNVGYAAASEAPPLLVLLFFVLCFVRPFLDLAIISVTSCSMTTCSDEFQWSSSGVLTFLKNGSSNISAIDGILPLSFWKMNFITCTTWGSLMLS